MKGKEKRSIGPSRVVPHRSRTCLISLLGWEAVSQADMAALKAPVKLVIHLKLYTQWLGSYLPTPLAPKRASGQPTYLPHMQAYQGSGLPY